MARADHPNWWSAVVLWCWRRVASALGGQKGRERMMDIVERLRGTVLPLITHAELREAADEIERLRELLRGVGANRYWEGRWRDEAAENERLRAALQTLVDDVLEYENINNLAPNPGKQDCWQSVTRAKAVLKDGSGWW